MTLSARMPDDQLRESHRRNLARQPHFSSPEEEDAKDDLRALTPVCPRCDCNLSGKKHPTGIAWGCSSCGGQSLNFSQFRRMVPELHVNEIWLTAMEEPVPARHRTRCPECRRDMTAVLVPHHGNEVELDICRTCQRLWLENQQHKSERLDITGDSPSGRKPPLIRLTGRGVDDRAYQAFKEKLSRVEAFTRSQSEKRPIGFPSLVVLVISALLGWLLRRHS